MDKNEYGPWDEVPGKCNSRCRTKEGLCRNPAGKGTDHKGYGACAKHCGNTPTHVKGAQNLMAQDAVKQYGLPVEVDPHQALLEEVHRTAGHVAWLGRLIGEYEEKEDLVDTDYDSPRIWLQLYQAERKHLKEVCKTAIGCGIAERHVQLAEDQGRMIATVFRKALSSMSDAGIDPGSPEAMSLVSEELRKLEGEVG